MGEQDGSIGSGERASDVLPVEPPAAEPVALGAEDRRYRGVRRWLTCLTILVALLTLSVCGVGGCAAWGMYDPFGMTPWGYESEEGDMTASIEEDIRSGFGSDVESVEVRRVEVDWGEPMMFGDPFMPTESAYAVQYRLAGADVLCATVVSPMMGASLQEIGLVPPRNAISSRMDTDRFIELLAVYADNTQAPFGGLHRYTSDDMMMGGGPLPETITIDDREYASGNLWMAVEGTVLEGDTYDMDHMESDTDALVFYEDPETGGFEFLGVEAYWGPF